MLQKHFEKRKVKNKVEGAVFPVHVLEAYEGPRG